MFKLDATKMLLLTFSCFSLSHSKFIHIQTGINLCKPEQIIAKWCKSIANWWTLVQVHANWCKLVQIRSNWWILVSTGSNWCKSVQTKAKWFKLLHTGAKSFKSVGHLVGSKTPLESPFHQYICSIFIISPTKNWQNHHHFIRSNETSDQPWITKSPYFLG